MPTLPRPMASSRRSMAGPRLRASRPTSNRQIVVEKSRDAHPGTFHMCRLKTEPRSQTPPTARSTGAAARLGMADHALDRRETRAQGPLQLVDPLMHLGHREQGVDQAMKID